MHHPWRIRVVAVAVVTLFTHVSDPTAAGAGATHGGPGPSPRFVALRSNPRPLAAPDQRPMPLTAEQRALLEIQRRGASTVHALGVRWRTLPEGAERRALEREAAEAKHRTRLEFLRALAGFQRARGEAGEARRTEMILDRLTETRPAPPTGSAAAPGAAPRKAGRP
jgi:hypothetical protein